jgi:tryptophan synthase alpha chain
MSKIKQKFYNVKTKNKKLLIPFITCGDPDIDTTSSLVIEMEKNGADIIELGIPYSDPLADGIIIQRANTRALSKNINIKNAFELIKSLREKTNIPIILMTYYNPVYNYGIKNFARDAKDNGCDGVIISDLPPEESEELRKYTKKFGVDLIFLLAPTSTEERIKLIDKLSSSFIYCISRYGTTGLRNDLYLGLEDFIKNVRKHTKKPLGVGFGISNQEQAKKVSKFCDAIIIGSAIVKIIEENLENKNLVKSVGRFIKNIKEVI